MSVPGAAVRIFVPLEGNIYSRLTNAIKNAIAQAKENTMTRLETFALSRGSQVPVDTGKLITSFDIRKTPTGLSMKWSALSPTGYDYAKIQDIGGPTGRGGYIKGNYYSDVMRGYAKEWYMEELVRALEAINP